MFYLQSFKAYVNIIIVGVFIVMKKVLVAYLQIWNSAFKIDRFLFIFLLISSFFLIGGWRSYHIIFNSEYTYFHKITTNDLLLFIALKSILFISFLFINIFNMKKLGFFLQLTSIACLLFLYIVSYLYPERITYSKDTQFTWQFYFYGFSLICIVVSSFLSLIKHSQKI